MPGVHVEVKRVERLNIHDAMQQAVRDSSGTVPQKSVKPLIPIVAHRRNRDKWMITMLAHDWFAFFREWEAQQTLSEKTQKGSM